LIGPLLPLPALDGGVEEDSGEVAISIVDHHLNGYCKVSGVEEVYDDTRCD